MKLTSDVCANPYCAGCWKAYLRRRMPSAVSARRNAELFGTLRLIAAARIPNAKNVSLGMISRLITSTHTAEAVVPVWKTRPSCVVPATQPKGKDDRRDEPGRHKLKACER